MALTSAALGGTARKPQKDTKGLERQVQLQGFLLPIEPGLGNLNRPGRRKEPDDSAEDFCLEASRHSHSGSPGIGNGTR